MTDKKQGESKTSEDKKTETKSDQGFSTSISLTPAIEKSSDDKPKQPEKSKTQKSVNENKSTMKTPEKVTTSSTLKKTKGSNQKLSKIAVLALFIALLAASSVGVLYYLSIEKQEKFEQQQALAENNILQKTQQSLAKSERQIKQLLDQQQKRVSKQLTRDIASIENDSQVKINELTKVVERLSQNQPSDWLLHEAEYLIRIATRTLWLEHDTQAAISLLQDADVRLKELENPEFLPIRQLIREDIAQLKLMPNIDSEDTILTLMAMNQQLKSLPVKSERIPENFVTQVELDLSEDIADWKENLDKTWQYFADSFFRISDRSGETEALLSPQFQQNLRENLSLKLQLAQWSASKGKQKIYDQTLIDIQQWLTQFFDMTAIENENFHLGIEQLKNEVVSYDYPATLSSLQAIRKALTVQPLKPILEQLEQESKTMNPVIDTPHKTQESKLAELPESTSETL